MKKTIIALSMAMGMLAGAASANELPGMHAIENAVCAKPQFVQKNEAASPVLTREVVRIKVDYIVDEDGKNYVVFIQSNRPEVHERIIRMVENMPAQSGTEHRKNNVVIEYEL